MRMKAGIKWDHVLVFLWKKVRLDNYFSPLCSIYFVLILCAAYQAVCGSWCRGQRQDPPFIGHTMGVREKRITIKEWLHRDVYVICWMSFNGAGHASHPCHNWMRVNVLPWVFPRYIISSVCPVVFAVLYILLDHENNKQQPDHNHLKRDG